MYRGMISVNVFRRHSMEAFESKKCAFVSCDAVTNW